ncbi:identified by similarity to GB.1 [Rubellimicrobium mesophilum DSM 19309]|uniref:Identified by similarity to GB.1 n=1 Tax=Rubellimicrobium mesophilum DSM 19309 TaxID=442562 RepID=A0A017HVX6_9RHOB|nr:DUF1194 domain-containing protein [Rubellimicrobium mesophilum]EYD78323.1 identified by similarity to GB.1 [Rubellimicrobium mesophilum DSM 19309]
MRTWGGLALALGLAGPAGAEGCRLALVLALDVSVSVDAEEDRLQREGLARALMAPEVASAFLRGDPVALFAFDWSGAASQRAILPGWVVVEAQADLARVAAAIAGSRRTTGPSDFTAVGAALEFAGAALAEAPPCRGRTVDISGDGQINDGPRPSAVYADPLWEGVTVNALVIGGAEDGRTLGAWFEADVCGDPGRSGCLRTAMATMSGP